MSLYCLVRCFYRDGRLLNILAAVALLFIVWDPAQLFDAAFTLLSRGRRHRRFRRSCAQCHLRTVLAQPRALSDGKKDLRIPAKSAQFRLELRLLAHTSGW